MKWDKIVFTYVTFGLRLACDDRTMPIIAFSYGLRRVTMSLRFYDMFSKYKYLIVNLVFSHLVFGVGSQKGLLADIEWAPYDFHFEFADTLRFPSDLRTDLIQDVGESQGKKTDGRINC